MTAALLAEIWRGEVLEVRIRGHLAAVDADDRLVAAVGDPDALTTLRSAVKPLQALALVESGAAEALRLTTAELALACASHLGEPAHVATARTLLARAGLDETALSCGPHWPAGDEAARRLAAEGGSPGRIHNNCSGKHAGMLAACVHRGWPVDGYADAGHPLQREISAVMGEVMRIDLAAAPAGVDGCGLMTQGVPLRALARGLAVAQAERPGFHTCQDAMAAHPEMVRGQGAFDTVLLAAAGGRLTAKTGGAAVWAAVSRHTGIGVALKLEAGTSGHLAPVALAALVALGLLPEPLTGELRGHARGEVRNWEGAVVGETRVVARLEPA